MRSACLVAKTSFVKEKFSIHEKQLDLFMAANKEDVTVGGGKGVHVTQSLATRYTYDNTREAFTGERGKRHNDDRKSSCPKKDTTFQKYFVPNTSWSCCFFRSSLVVTSTVPSGLILGRSNRLAYGGSNTARWASVRF